MFVAAVCAHVVQDNALRLDDPQALALVRDWYDATAALRRFALERGASDALDLVDVSTLAEMFLVARARGSEAA